jgi:hypothetical protein
MKICILLTLSLFIFVAKASSLPALSDLLIEAGKVKWDDSLSKSIIIKAPLKTVWDYASDSTKARDWSVYFDHISPLPGVPDGMVGSVRRCFRNANEKGPYWDEVTIETLPEASRQIVTYNLSNFMFNFIVDGQYAFVRQLYRALDETTTELTFQTGHPSDANFRTKLGFKLAESETAEIFEKNLQNIKAAIEKKPRLYGWE